MGIDSWLQFQRLVISCFQVRIFLKFHKSNVNPPKTNQPVMQILISIRMLVSEYSINIHNFITFVTVGKG